MKGGGGWTVSKGPSAWGCFEEDGRVLSALTSAESPSHLAVGSP